MNFEQLGLFSPPEPSEIQWFGMESDTQNHVIAILLSNIFTPSSHQKGTLRGLNREILPDPNGTLKLSKILWLEKISFLFFKLWTMNHNGTHHATFFLK